MNNLIKASRVPESIREVHNLETGVLHDQINMLTTQVGALQQVLAIMVNKYGEDRPEGGKHVALTELDMRTLNPETQITTMMDAAHTYHIYVYEKEEKKR